MRKQSHVRAVLAATLVVLALAPMASALAGPPAEPHSCCRHDESFQTAPSGQAECCIVSAQPGPAQAAVAPLKRVAHEVTLASEAEVAISLEAPSQNMTLSEAASSPPQGPSCSSILRI